MTRARDAAELPDSGERAPEEFERGAVDAEDEPEPLRFCGGGGPDASRRPGGAGGGGRTWPESAEEPDREEAELGAPDDRELLDEWRGFDCMREEEYWF